MAKEEEPGQIDKSMESNGDSANDSQNQQGHERRQEIIASEESNCEEGLRNKTHNPQNNNNDEDDEGEERNIDDQALSNKTAKKRVTISDNSEDGVSKSATKQKRSKSFTGCYTCRRRKIACDLGRPSCQKCRNSGFVCEGYDVKLRWSQPLEFDKYGYQLPSKPNQETEYCQRRAIAYVKYSDETVYKLYDEMDADLAKLHKWPLSSTSDDTVIEGHFGVFRGTKVVPKKNKRKSQNKEKTERAKRIKPIKENDSPKKSPSTLNHPVYKTMTKNQNFLYPTNVSNSIVAPNNFDFNKGNSVGNEWLSTELLDAALLTASAINGDTHFLDMFDLENTQNNNPTQGSHTITQKSVQNGSLNNNHPQSTATMSSSNANIKSANAPSNIISNELTSANSNSNSNIVLNGSNVNNLANHVDSSRTEIFNDNLTDQMLHLLFQGRNAMLPPSNLSPLPSNIGTGQPRHQLQHQHQQQHSIQQRQVLPESGSITNKQQSYHQQSPKALRFQPTSRRQSIESSHTASSMSMTTRIHPNANHNTAASQMSPEEIASSIQSIDDVTSSSVENTGIVPTTNQNNKFKINNQSITDNEINIHASNNIKMPKNIMEILATTPLPKSLSIDKFGIPTTSLNVHPMARYLLNYYIEDVADMMTVIPLAKNPWKFIYFPRALMAVGELASLGKTSNARNGLLNALLAVSAFNLQSKFVRGSDEMKYYVDLGIQLRKQANEFVNKCMEEDILKQKYKDVLVAVLSMVTIDVVWGTMSSCKIHLDHCEKIIEKKMMHKKKLSSKAIILHRIFSSLKLIQDSTSLENISKSEIFLNEKNYKNFLTGSKPTQEQLDNLNNDHLRGIFRGNARSKKNAANKDGGSNIKDLNVESDEESNFRSHSNTTSTRLDMESPAVNMDSPSSVYQSRSNTNNSLVKRGKYNEKITDNGKIRIEFIVNNDEENEDNEEIDLNADIPAFVDITRTSFKPSKNKLDDKVVSSDAIYGLPNSLILMFGEVVPLTRFKKYHEDHKMPLPSFFDELARQLEFKLLSWKLEWTLIVEDEGLTGINNEPNIGVTTGNDFNSLDDNKKNFISPRHEGIYHHVMSFYHALIIYFYRFIEDVNPMYLLERIEKVLYHLNKIQEILENNKETSYIIPLFWQGFIAGSEAMTLYLQNGFNKWGQDIAQTGIGTYWNARQIMLEIWRRKNHNVKNNSWVDVLRDWKTNVMLT